MPRSSFSGTRTTPTAVTASFSGTRTTPTAVMATVRNWYKCDEAAGTTITAATSGACKFTFTSTDWVTSPGGKKWSTADSTVKTKTSGSFENFTDNADLLFMVLISTNSNIVNWGIGKFSNEIPSHPNFHTDFYSFGVIPEEGRPLPDGELAMVGLAALNNATALRNGTILRLAIKCVYGMGWYLGVATQGNDLNWHRYKEVSTGTAGPWSSCGKFATWDTAQQEMMCYVGFAGLPNLNTQLYSLMTVEFPNRFPRNVDDQINDLFAEWESNNKIAWPNADIG